MIRKQLALAVAVVCCAVPSGHGWTQDVGFPEETELLSDDYDVSFEIDTSNADSGVHLPETFPGEIESFGPGILHINRGEIELAWSVFGGRVRVDPDVVGVDLTGVPAVKWAELLSRINGPAATVICRGCKLNRTVVLRLKNYVKLPLLLSFPDSNLPEAPAAHLWDGVDGRILALLLEGCNLTDEHLPSFAALKNLSWMDISRTPVGDDGLKTISSLSGLRELRLRKTRVTADGLSHLSPGNGLRVLRLDLPALPDTVWSLLQELPQMRYVELLGGGFRLEGRSTTARWTPPGDGGRRPVRKVTDWMAGTQWSGGQRVKHAREARLDLVKSLLADAGVPFPPRQLLLRGFKKEKEVEVWASGDRRGPLVHVATYAICLMSGNLGPKREEGDMQVPEGFYYLNYYNKNSAFHLSFRVNYPNGSDRILGKKGNLGGAIMFHGSCASIGCLSMGDEGIEELWVFTRALRDRGRRVHVHLLPTRNMETLVSVTAEGELKAFWANLKEGDDLFRKNRVVPTFAVNSRGEYVFSR